MGDIEKRLNVSAFKKATTWGTEVDVNTAGTGILPLNPGAIKRNIVTIEDKAAGSAFLRNLDFGDYRPVDFGLEFDLRYEGLGPMIAMIMGTAGAPAQQGETAAYLHTLQLANKIYGLFGTYATEKHDKIHVVQSAKPYKITLTPDGGKVKATINLVGNDMIDDSSIITSMDSVTIPDTENRVLTRQGVFRLNAQDGAALGSGDEIKIKDFTIEIVRVPKTDDYSVGQRYINECHETDIVNVKINLSFNHYDDDNKVYFSDWNSESEKKMDIVFTGATIEDAYSYYHKFQFPRLKIEDVNNPDDEIIPLDLTLRGIPAASAPTGMTGITNPLQWDIMNKRTTDMLG